MNTIKKTVAILLAAVLVLGLAACGSDTTTVADGDSPAESVGSSSGTAFDALENASDGRVEGQPASGMVDNVVVGMGSASFDVSPFGGTSNGRDWFVQNMYACLVYLPYYGAPLEDAQLWLAKEVTQVDDLTYRVELHDNIYDNKGNQILADDIVFSYEMCSTVGEVTDLNTGMESITALDDYNLEIKLKMVGPGLIEAVLGHYRLSTVNEAWYNSAGDDERTNDPAVTGAYRIKEYIPGSSLVLEAVEDYWMPEDIRPNGAKQNVRTITYKVIAEDAMRSIALENGEIDVCQVGASELQRFYANGAPVGEWNVLVNGGNMHTVMLLNMDENESVLATDENLRKAILTVLNSEDIMLAAGNTNDTGMVTSTMGTSAMGGYQTKWEEEYWPYDLALAQEYMAASNYPDGLTLRLLSRSTVSDGVHSVIMMLLEQIGIETELMAFDQALFNNYKYDSTQWDLILDTKGSSGGHVASGWDELFNPDGYTNGGACFTHDDHLVELLYDAFQNYNDPDKVDAFHQYLIELAPGKSLHATLKFTVSNVGILELTPSFSFNPCVNAYVFAEDFVSAAD